MKGTILDFLKLASDTPELSQELVDLAMKYGFEFTDEVSEEELDSVAGGADTTFRTWVKVMWTPPAPTTGSALNLSLGDESSSGSGTASSSYSGRSGGGTDVKSEGSNI